MKIFLTAENTGGLKRRLMLAAVMLWTGAMPAAGQELVPIPEPPPGLTPASDKEETGALTDMLPGFLDPLTLPAEEAGGLSAEENAERAGPGLFPAEIWSGEQVPLPAPDTPPEPDAPLPAEGSVLPPEVLASSFGTVPPPPLHDPQHLLAPADAAALRELLGNSLNARGTFQTSVVLLRPSQQIPVALNPPELLESWHGESKGLLVLYFMGRPERTQAFFSPSVRRQHRSEDLRQVLDFGVREAARMTAPAAQLQRFCYKTAIRLDRLHRQGIVTPTDEPLPPLASAVPAHGLWWAFAVGVHAAGLAVAAVWWWRRRRAEPGRAGAPIYLPEQEFVPRLGAAHSGGFGEVIHFGPAGRL